ncbi:uncharacterized protein BYT42DRAFT_591703 [Radiomyces spectabilis]|uniref:uncharacterized protein n=1 Tax=Radiomyces spectabilis TaxID=64574 RepID=UPI00221FB3A8|nr:uncharacterized protein BYT42DRAFT_591703 [Radiomyces spectabilis]KAI8390908.1 hypothetical protein BYT42DRAFT_591703 [Radiomyces spectabilis]
MLFDLMGVLMIRNTSMQSSGFAADAWCLYMRDYIEDVSGSAWRISSQQALADISNTPVKTDNQSQVAPSETSLEFHPVYLFYCNEDLTNLDLSQRTEHANSSNSEITFEDYTFDDDEHVPDVYQQQYEEEDDTVCKHCGIAETADDINTIFFCDECNAGVHMLCEDPPISKYEFDIDPWYCRACSRRKGLPLPQPPLSDSLGIKRKHEETS